MKHSMQISESIGLGTILALSGGFMDAYSYIERGKVFANAQTGNMLLFGVNLSEGCMNVLLNGSYSILLKKEHYFLYCVMYSLQLGLLSGLLSVLAGYFSLYIHNRVTVLALPIIIYQILIECSGNTIYTVFIFRAYNRPMNKDWESFSLILLISIIPTILLGCLIYKKIQKRL